jgi:hypothetical protein
MLLADMPTPAQLMPDLDMASIERTKPPPMTTAQRFEHTRLMYGDGAGDC